jgi:hypothetical protein
VTAKRGRELAHARSKYAKEEGCCGAVVRFCGRCVVIQHHCGSVDVVFGVPILLKRVQACVRRDTGASELSWSSSAV